MLARREIDRETRRARPLRCVNAGPLLSHLRRRRGDARQPRGRTRAARRAGALLPRRRRARLPGRAARQSAGRAPERSRDAFVNAVRSAASGILSICAFVVAFSAVTALLRAVGLTGALAGALGKLFPALGSPSSPPRSPGCWKSPAAASRPRLWAGARAFCSAPSSSPFPPSASSSRCAPAFLTAAACGSGAFTAPGCSTAGSPPSSPPSSPGGCPPPSSRRPPPSPPPSRAPIPTPSCPPSACSACARSSPFPNGVEMFIFTSRNFSSVPV